MAIEIHEIIRESLDIKPDIVKFYTDSQVVLGYINNTTRRFYTYVWYRVNQIRSKSNPSDWKYVNTKHNPADLWSISSSKFQDSKWLNGPVFLQSSEECIHCNTVFPLLDPEYNKEVRTDVIVQKTQLAETPLINRFREMTHLSEPKKLNPQIMKEAETFIVKKTQRNVCLDDIDV